MSLTQLKKYLIICLLNFFAASVLGVMLRYAFTENTSLNFGYILHAHSHTAALGWVYQVLTALIIYFFIPVFDNRYRYLFWITQIAVVGMLCSFPFQGYGAVSISFSVLHILCSYYFVYLIWKNAHFRNPAEKIFIRAALIFLVISTFGIWLLAPVMVLFGKSSVMYHLVIQFYLHFQFQGWFIFGVLGIFVRTKENVLRFIWERSDVKILLYLFVFSAVLSFGLVLHHFFPSLLWMFFNDVAALVPAVLVVFVGYLFMKTGNFESIKFNSIFKMTLLFAVFCFVLKIVFHFFTIHPDMATASFQIRNYSIGYLHLIMLGFVSISLITFAVENLFPRFSFFLIAGILVFAVAVTVTLALTFVQGLLFQVNGNLIAGYFEWMFYVSILFPVSLILLICGFLKTNSA
ncbi:MAG: hypothetical protein JNJ99_00795 [Crocinitomicaceae bacterium]|nr:hypothetical protein [Crocinitomicaceae bacterium]